MVLVGIGGCIVFDVVLILKKGCYVVSGCDVILKVECVDIDFKIFIYIYFYYWVKGMYFKLEVVVCVIELLKDKYCLVLIMIGKIVEIIYDFEIV